MQKNDILREVFLKRERLPIIVYQQFGKVCSPKYTVLLKTSTIKPNESSEVDVLGKEPGIIGKKP